MPERHFKMPPLEWIRAFEAAARTGTFTAAAAETGLTQSAVSQRIGHLEKLLGTRLFERRRRGIELTVEGEAWLPHVRTALDSLRESSEALFGAGRGRLTISASLSVIELWLLPRLAALREICDGQISLQTMVVGAHDVPVDEVIRIRYGAGDWPHHYRHRLYPERIAPVAAPALARGNGHWTEWPRIACSGTRPEWKEWTALFGVPTTPVPHLRFDTSLSALGAARAGMGVFLASLPLCAADLAAGKLVRLGDDVLDHHESYWLLAGREAISRGQWDRLAAAVV